MSDTTMTTSRRRGRSHRHRPDSVPHNHQPSVIRIAQRSEEAELIEVCRELWEENGLFSFSEDKVRAILQRSFDKNLAMVGVIGAPGKIEACACLLITQFYYSDDWHIEELWNYVRPPYRRSEHARAMVEWAKEMSDRLGIKLVMGVVSEDRLIAKIRLYRRFFGEVPAGMYFCYDPKKIRKANVL
jgi:GNAT superfamily N-acetyltransferase